MEPTDTLKVTLQVTQLLAGTGFRGVGSGPANRVLEPAGPLLPASGAAGTSALPRDSDLRFPLPGGG